MKEIGILHISRLLLIIEVGKKHIEYLESSAGHVYDQVGMLRVALDFYKNLFAEEPSQGVSLGADFWADSDMVREDDNSGLEGPFSEEEIKEAIFSCYPEGAPSPDGLPFLFYQKFWHLVGKDIVALFRDFYDGNLDLYRLNFAVVTLVPKVEDARNMK